MLPPYITNILTDLLQRGSLSGPQPIDLLNQYNHALRVAAGLEFANEAYVAKAATAGYGLQGVPFDTLTVPGSTLGPLMPQSIQPTIDNLTFLATDLKITSLFSKQDVVSTTHEWVQRVTYGDDRLTAFAREGAVAPISTSHFQRKTANVYTLMEVREYTDVANLVRLLGGAGISNAATLEMNDGAINFLRKREHAYLWSDNRCNEDAFTGLFPSIKQLNPGFIVDARNGMPLPQQINNFIAALRSAPNFADINNIKVLTSIQGKVAFNNYAIVTARTDGLKSNKVMGYDYENSRFVGGVEIEDALFLDHWQHPSGRDAGQDPPPDVASLTPVFAALAPPPALTNNWTAAETSGLYDYYYWIEIHGDGGYVSSGPIGPVTPAAGDAIRLQINNPPNRIGPGGGKYMEIYRARVLAGQPAPTSVSDYFWIMDEPFNLLNAGNTEIWDVNEQVPGTTNMLIGEFSPRVMQCFRLMDSYIRPLFRQLSTTTPFAIVAHEDLKLKAPNKLIWIRNVPKA